MYRKAEGIAGANHLQSVLNWKADTDDYIFLKLLKNNIDISNNGLAKIREIDSI